MCRLKYLKKYFRGFLKRVLFINKKKLFKINKLFHLLIDINLGKIKL